MVHTTATSMIGLGVKKVRGKSEKRMIFKKQNETQCLEKASLFHDQNFESTGISDPYQDVVFSVNRMLTQENEIANDKPAGVYLKLEAEEFSLRLDLKLGDSKNINEKEAEKYLDEEPGKIEFGNETEYSIFGKIGYCTKPFDAFENSINVWIDEPWKDEFPVYKIKMNLDWKPSSFSLGARIVHYHGSHMFVLVNRQNRTPLIFGRKITNGEIERLKSGNKQSPHRMKEIEREDYVQFVEEIINIDDDDDEAILLPGGSSEPNLREEPEFSAAREENEKRNPELDNEASASSSLLSEAIVSCDENEHLVFGKIGYCTKRFFEIGNLINVWIDEPWKDGVLVYKIKMDLTRKPFSCPLGARMAHYHGGYMFVLANGQNLPPPIVRKKITNDEIRKSKNGTL